VKRAREINARKRRVLFLFSFCLIDWLSREFYSTFLSRIGWFVADGVGTIHAIAIEVIVELQHTAAHDLNAPHHQHPHA
jgi:hypothetical protein